MDQMTDSVTSKELIVVKNLQRIINNFTLVQSYKCFGLLQFIVLVFQRSISVFTALVNLLSSSSGLFSALNSRQTHLATSW